MQFAANHNHVNSKGHSPTDGSPHVTPESCSKTSGRKSSSPELSSIKVPTTRSCELTDKSHRRTSLPPSFTSPLFLSPTSPPQTTKVPVKSVHTNDNQSASTQDTQKDTWKSIETVTNMSDNSSSNTQEAMQNTGTSLKTGAFMSDNSSSNTQEAMQNTGTSLKTGAFMSDNSSSNTQEAMQNTGTSLKTGAFMSDNSSSDTQAQSATISKEERHISDDSSNSDFETSNVNSEFPFTSPAPRESSSGAQQTSSPVSSKLSRIRQNNLASKKREQMNIRKGRKLPELSENSELEELTLQSTTVESNGSHTSFAETTANKMPQMPITDENNDAPSKGPDNTVTPSTFDKFLRKLGVAVSNGSSGDNFSLDQLPEKEIESTFVCLALAFKTDKLTLDQRVTLQERSRDLAERNVDTELHGLRETVEVLNDLATDKQIRGILHKIKKHIGILEQLAATVSSRAEVYGAVQQEKRMCKAMEVMVMYTENLRRIREKEETELQEARKLLSEKSGTGYSNDSESGPSRRSMSVCGISPSGRPMRRRSEVTLPRIIGGAGSPPLNQTSNLEPALFLSKRTPISTISLESAEKEDPKARFQCAVASTTMQQAVATTLKRCSLEKQRSISMPSVPSEQATVTLATPTLHNTSSSSTLCVKSESTSEKVSEIQGEKQETGSKSSQEEEAFRKGYEEGLKARLSQELSDLRNQQTSISQSLDQVMDKVDTSQMEDLDYISSPSWFEMAMALTAKIRDHILLYDWRSNKTTIRNLTGLTFLIMAFIVVFLCPPMSSVGIGRFAKPAT